MRHYDYERIFDELGYVIHKSIAMEHSKKYDKISDDFDKSNPSLFATKGIFLLEKK